MYTISQEIVENVEKKIITMDIFFPRYHISNSSGEWRRCSIVFIYTILYVLWWDYQPYKFVQVR